MPLSGPEKLVLESLKELQGDSGRPVSEDEIQALTKLSIDDIRYALQSLQERELVSLAFTKSGVVSFIEARGRLALRKTNPSATVEPIKMGDVARVLVAGLTGTGKSSLINAILGQVIMNVVSIFPGTVEEQSHKTTIDRVALEIMDCPGLGAGKKFDKKTIDLCKTLLENSKVLLWAVRADTKVVSLDSDYFEELHELAVARKVKVLVPLTFCDRMQPGEWDSLKNTPDNEQARSIDLRRIYLSGILQIPPSQIIECSSPKGFGIDLLKREILKAFPRDQGHALDAESTERARPHMTVLYLGVNPPGTIHLRLDREVKEVEKSLERSPVGGEFKLIQKWAVTDDDLRRALLDNEPEIVHFSGHGSEMDGLAFEDDTGQVHLIPGDSLSRLFELCSDTVKCVVLNACYSEAQANAIVKHIDYVVGMKQEIGDEAAIKFAVGFYDALVAGRDVETAFNWGCNAIDLKGIPESQTPVLKRKW